MFYNNLIIILRDTIIAEDAASDRCSFRQYIRPLTDGSTDDDFLAGRLVNDVIAEDHPPTSQVLSPVMLTIRILGNKLQFWSSL